MRYFTSEFLSISTKYFNHNHCFQQESCFELWQRIETINGHELRITIPFSLVMSKGKESIYFKELRINEKLIESVKLDCFVDLVSESCNLGGIRWWFKCPVATHDQKHTDQVGILYLSHIEGKGIGCRHCHQLQYASSKRRRVKHPQFPWGAKKFSKE